MPPEHRIGSHCKVRKSEALSTLSKVDHRQPGPKPEVLFAEFLCTEKLPLFGFEGILPASARTTLRLRKSALFC